MIYYYANWWCSDVTDCFWKFNTMTTMTIMQLLIWTITKNLSSNCQQSKNVWHQHFLKIKLLIYLGLMMLLIKYNIYNNNNNINQLFYKLRSTLRAQLLFEHKQLSCWHTNLIKFIWSTPIYYFMLFFFQRNKYIRPHINRSIHKRNLYILYIFQSVFKPNILND